MRQVFDIGYFWCIMIFNMAEKFIKIDWGRVRSKLISKEKIKPESAIAETADECLKEAESLASACVISVKKKLLSFESDHIRLEGPVKLSGKGLSSYMKGATHIYLFLATIGPGLEESATEWMKKGESLSGYLLDRIGSFAVEALAENFENNLREIYASKDESVSMRFSPGYCDWPIEEQFELAGLLDFAGAGVRLTEGCMMVPKKSISGVVGTGPKGLFSKDRSQCMICNRSDCDYRRI